MKSTNSLLFCAFASLVFLFPWSVKAQLSSQNAHLTVSSFNDSWGGAFTQAKDDQRSFGALIDYQFLIRNKLVQSRITYSTLTNRYAKSDVSGMNEIEMYLRYPVWVSEGENTWLSVVGGAMVAGNLGGERIQNRVHQRVNVATVDLPYAEETKSFPFVGGQLWVANMLAFRNVKSRVKLESKFDYQLAPGYNQLAKVQMGPSISGHRNDKVSLQFGYANNKAFYDNAALQSVANTETGFFVNYGMRLGMANFGFTAYPNAQFTNGYLGITLLNGTAKKPLRKIDVISETGAMSKDKGLYVRYLWNRTGTNINKWLLDFQYQFWTLGKKYSADNSYNLGNYQQFSAGVNYHFIRPRETFQILPYISTRAGIKQTRTYGVEKFATDNSTYNFMLLSEGGLRVKLPGNVAKRNCFYGLTPSYTMAHTFGRTLQTEFYFGLGGFVMIDF